MVDYQKNIAAEMEQVAQAIAKLPPGDLSELNDLELSGVGGILQSVYNGIENILKQTFLHTVKPFQTIFSGINRSFARPFSMDLSQSKRPTG